jgi:hypothetical protein
MDLSEALKSLEEKFTSGNEVSVSRATITREEWEAIQTGLCKCKTKHKKENHFYKYVDGLGISHCVVDTGD